MGPAQNPRRTSDPDGSDFTDLRVPSQRHWKKVLFIISSIATFIGTLWMVTTEKRQGNETAPFDAQIITERLARIESKINMLNSSADDVRASLEQHGASIREVKRIAYGIDRARSGAVERAEERHAEIMSLLTEFKEKGIRRK